jgi:hypothetical protein
MLSESKILRDKKKNILFVLSESKETNKKKYAVCLKIIVLFESFALFLNKLCRIYLNSKIQ